MGGLRPTPEAPACHAATEAVGVLRALHRAGRTLAAAVDARLGPDGPEDEARSGFDEALALALVELPPMLAQGRVGTVVGRLHDLALAGRSMARLARGRWPWRRGDVDAAAAAFEALCAAADAAAYSAAGPGRVAARTPAREPRPVHRR